MKLLSNVLCALLALGASTALASQVDIQGPPGSLRFGQGLVPLANGNLLVLDPQIENDRGAVHLYSSRGQWLATEFGRGVIALAGGNFAVADPPADSGRGAVHLYSPTGQRISTLRGSTPGDRVGFAIEPLPGGNFLVRSPNWHNGGAQDAGAVTWIDGRLGLDGVVSAQNSLVGSSSFDSVGTALDVLGNGNYVVRSPLWDRTSGGVATNAGAITFGRGSAGVSGIVSAANSLVGTSADDHLGQQEITELSNGNFVVIARDWNNLNAVDAGAIRWVNGQSGAVGELAASNALVGSTSGDSIGSHLHELADGSYYISSETWHEGTRSAGALTWCPGLAPCSGAISLANSLVGTSAGDFLYLSGLALPAGGLLVLAPNWTEPTQSLAQAGAAFLIAGAAGPRGHLNGAITLHGANAGDRVGDSARVLSDGNVVVLSPFAKRGGLTVGASTWINAGNPAVGTISTFNSLFGIANGDGIGLDVVPLTQGRYVVACPNCDVAGVVDSGAVVWSPATGAIGEIGTDRALRGLTTGDRIGSQVVALDNGHYVVSSPSFSNSILFPRVGAVTWVNGSNGHPRGESVPGVIVTSGNSLVGRTANDRVGTVIPLANGNYVVASPEWSNGTVLHAGAVTWADGAQGVSGIISAVNSLVGDSADDRVGSGFTTLPNGNALIASPSWDEVAGGTVFDSGAVTWMDGRRGLAGHISAQNSLLSNRQYGAGVGIPRVLPNGDYVVLTPNANHCTSSGCDLAAGAISLGKASRPLAGRIDARNSILGNISNEGDEMIYEWDAINRRVLVGRPTANTVSWAEFSLFDDGFDP